MASVPDIWNLFFIAGEILTFKICVFKDVVIFQLIAKGKNASELFPAVVKNVASKNLEVRASQKSLNIFVSLNCLKIL